MKTPKQGTDKNSCVPTRRECEKWEKNGSQTVVVSHLGTASGIPMTETDQIITTFNVNSNRIWLTDFS